MEILLGKMGEVVLKGLNRRQFENRMLKNIRYRLNRIGRFKVYAVQSAVYAEPESGDADMDAAFAAMQKVFGLVLVSRAYRCEKDITDIIETVKRELAADLKRAKTFKVEAKRSDKSFYMKSPEISAEVGGALHDAFDGIAVDLKNPEVTVFVEIRDYAAFVHTDPVAGAGGLPGGTAGRAALLLSGGIDSPVAAYMMAKRGLELEAVHFFSYPYTSERAKQKVLKLAKKLVEYCGYMTVHVVPFTRIQERIQRDYPEEYFTLIMRRSMMRISEAVARLNECTALITGESLGQVASQTVEAMAVTEAVTAMPVFRPVVGMDKEEIVKIARRIDTFETSILPYEDCCTVFTPKHPKTKPRLSAILELEEKAPLDELEKEAVDKVERIQILMRTEIGE
ncbi:MAG: tRNA 4-thiouridine(8) synthase ThiI [Oscillospiraceae bacterium]|jgi:thiamine biosynthesis protein ThiI|nr:tRNA 4-thiouridine(8) synthase ThiI [Oscillospiraceae bacterium]